MPTDICLVSHPLLNSIRFLMFQTAVALVTVVWDHLLTLDVEVSGIWNNPTEHIILKTIFILFRYGSDIALAYSAYRKLILKLFIPIKLANDDFSNHWRWR